MPKSKSKFMIQQYVEGVWKDLDSIEVENTADAIKSIKEKKLTGEFRIISIRGYVTSEAQTIVALDVQGVDDTDD